jgi:hypothetical protein
MTWRQTSRIVTPGSTVITPCSRSKRSIRFIALVSSTWPSRLRLASP